MRVIWHKEDIWAGRRVRHKEGGNITQEYIIGYEPSMSSKKNFCLISLADGMVCHQGMTADGLSIVLTASDIQPQEVLTDSNRRK